MRALAAIAFVAFVLTSAPRAEAGRGMNLLKYLPDDTSAVMIADVAKARRSPIFKKAFDLAREKHDVLDSLAQKVEVEKVVDTMVVGGGADHQHFVAIFEGKVDKLLAEAKKQSTKSETHGKVTYFVLPDGEVAVVDKRLVVTSAGDMAATLDRAADKKAKGPAAVRTLIAKAPSASNVFGAAVLDASARKDLSHDLGAEPQSLLFSMGLAQTLTLDAKLQFADEADAEKATRSLNDKFGAKGQSGTIRDQVSSMVGQAFADSITIDQDHAVTRLAATMTAEEVDKLLTFAKMLL
jgi:hypothetical protein